MSGKGRAWITTGLMLISVLFLCNAALGDSASPYVRFSSPRLNTLFLFCVFLLPVFGNALLWMARSPSKSHPPLQSKISLWIAILLIPAGFVSLFMAGSTLLFSGDSIVTDKPSPFFLFEAPKLAKIILIDDTHVMIYRDGDRKSDKLWIEQERPIVRAIPGLLRVLSIPDHGDAQNVTATALDSQRLKCVIPSVYQEGEPRSIVIDRL